MLVKQWKTVGLKSRSQFRCCQHIQTKQSTNSPAAKICTTDVHVETEKVYAVKVIRRGRINSLPSPQGFSRPSQFLAGLLFVLYFLIGSKIFFNNWT